MKPFRGMRKLDNCCNNNINHLNETKTLLQVRSHIPFNVKLDCFKLIYQLDLYFLSLDHDEKGCYEVAIKLCSEAIEMHQGSHSPNPLDIAICKFIDYQSSLYTSTNCNVNVCRYDVVRFV